MTGLVPLLLFTSEVRADLGLRDPPIAGAGEVLYLDGQNWTATGTAPAGSISHHPDMEGTVCEGVCCKGTVCATVCVKACACMTDSVCVCACACV